MSNSEPTAHDSGPLSPRLDGALKITELVAILGGILALALAMLVTANVVGRWLFNAPIDGDFELVQVGTAISVFAYMSYTQARRGNIMVDTFTGFLPLRVRSLIDAFWDLVFAAFMAFCAVGLTVGTSEFRLNGQATQQLLIPVWPVIGLCAVLSVLVAVTAVLTAGRLLRGRR